MARSSRLPSREGGHRAERDRDAAHDDERAPASVAEFLRRSATTPATGCFIASDSPQRPVSTSRTQAPYWTASGRSRPISCSSVRRAAGVAYSPEDQRGRAARQDVDRHEDDDRDEHEDHHDRGKATEDVEGHGRARPGRDRPLLPDLHATDQAVLDLVDVPNHLVGHDLAGEIADDLVDVDDDVLTLVDRRSPWARREGPSCATAWSSTPARHRGRGGSRPPCRWASRRPGAAPRGRARRLSH